MILQAILQGLALGLFLAIQPGPSFFALLQTSSKMGFKSGFGLAIGIFLSDVIYVVLAYLGIAQFFNNPENKKYISFAGGIILVIFGLMSIFNKKEDTANKTVTINEIKLPLYISKGFLLNFLNPSVLFLWVLYVGIVSSEARYTSMHVFLFFLTTLTTVFTSDTLKAYYANKISQHLSQKVLKNFNLLLGVILIVTGLVFIYRVIS